MRNENRDDTKSFGGCQCIRKMESTQFISLLLLKYNVQCTIYNTLYTIYISLHSKVKITSLTDVDAYSGGGALRIYFAKEISSTRNVVKQGYLPGGRR